MKQIKTFFLTAILFSVTLLVVLAIGVSNVKAAAPNPDSDFTISNGTITIYRGTTLTIVVPSEINGEAVTAIGDNVFNGRSSITEVTLPDSITSIGQRAFLGCSKLKSINIPDGVSAIQNSTFSGCNALESIVLPASVKSIGSSAFNSCYALTDIDISNVTSIGTNAFERCSKLTSIVIPDAITDIPTGAFSVCTALKDVTLPNTLKSIGQSAFSSCSAITSINIPDGVTTIGMFAFSGCTALTEVTLPDSITTIGNYIFRNCTALTKITLSANITRIESYTFENCTSLTNVTIPDKVTSIELSSFKDCAALTEISLPDSVTFLRPGAFAGCSGLTSIRISKNILSLSGHITGLTNLREVIIPNSATTIVTGEFTANTNFTVYGVLNSKAEDYANNKGATFNNIDEIGSKYKCVLSNSLTNQSDERIATPDNMSGITSMKVSLKNLGETELPAVLIVSFYDENGVLVDYVTQDVKLTGNTQSSNTKTLVDVTVTTIPDSAKEVKIMVWSDLEATIIPYMKSYTLQ